MLPYIDLETFFANKAFWRGSNADWFTFTLVMVIASGLAGLFVFQRGKRLLHWERRLAGGEELNAVPLTIRNWAATFPLFVATVNFVMWIVVGIFFAQGGLTVVSTDSSTFWRTLIGVALVGGLVNSALTFLLVDAFWRQRLPVFFPYGHLRVLEAPRVSVRTRLGATLLITGLVPLIVLGAAAQTSASNSLNPLFEPSEALARLQVTINFVVGASIVSSILIGTLTARSLLTPLHRLSAAMQRVAAGDLSVRLRVDSNDELGDLADSFNYMLADLEQAQRMRDLFGRYVSSEVAEQVLSNGADLGGENVAATALFADIRDFTGLSERLPAQQVVSILNPWIQLPSATGCWKNT